MSSSWVVTASVNTPRASFLNYPLGHTAGRPNELAEQIEVATAALELIESATASGRIVALPHEWPTEWRQQAPQYERADDEAAAAI